MVVVLAESPKFRVNNLRTQGTPTVVLIDASRGAGFVGDLPELVESLNCYLNRYVCPAWNHPGAAVKLAPEGYKLGPDEWPMTLLDASDVPGALGYHDMDPATGNPFARAFVKDTDDAGVTLSSVVSHELAEMIVDPHCNLVADDGAGQFYAVEAGDPVEDQSFDVDGDPVSAAARSAGEGSVEPVANPYCTRGHHGHPHPHPLAKRDSVQRVIRDARRAPRRIKTGRQAFRPTGPLVPLWPRNAGPTQGANPE